MIAKTINFKITVIDMYFQFVRSHSQPASPATQADIEEKLSAAANRRQMLDNLRVKNISDKLAKVGYSVAFIHTW